MKKSKLVRIGIALCISVLCLYTSVAAYYIVVRKHTLKEWITFSTSPDRIKRKATDRLGLPPRRWNRSGEWYRYPQNPVLTIGSKDSWDEGTAGFASVIKDDDNFKMYYSGRNSNQKQGQIGLAISNDGKNWFKMDSPIVKLGQPGSWDDTMIWCPMVWKETLYHMIYTGYDSARIIQIGYATSTDGIHWTKSDSNPVFNDSTWAHNHTEGCGVIKVEDTYLLWYNTLGVTPRQLCVAVSKDLLKWLPYKNTPVFSSMQETDRYNQFCAFPFRYAKVYYLIVTSQESSNNWGAFYLYRCKNPYFEPEDRECAGRILLPGHFLDWDDHDIDTPALLTLDITRNTFYKDSLWLYYSGEGGDNRWKVGLLIESNIQQCLQMPHQTRQIEK